MKLNVLEDLAPKIYVVLMQDWTWKNENTANLLDSHFIGLNQVCNFSFMRENDYFNFRYNQLLKWLTRLVNIQDT